MKRLRVDTSAPYDVVIGPGILKDLGVAVSALGKSYDKVALISDDTVAALYGDTAKQSLENAGFPVISYTFPHGEASKSMPTLLDFTAFLCGNYATRKSLVVALGGGVTGDLAGFAASIYQRGIDYVQVPTTLLAAIDSSVGGKTAVNIESGKNLLGSFWQPRLVWCDIDTLKTLDDETFRDGVAEAVKYGCIWDEPFFALMRDKGFNEGISDIISRCVEIKAEIVRVDERDNGLRGILNFGHTLGHGIEKLSGYGISHGKAVAIGMVLASRAGEAAGLTQAGTTAQIEDVLTKNGIHTACPYPLPDVCAASLGDKKRDGGNVGLILLKRLGEAFIHPVPVSELEAFFEGRG